MLKFSECIAEFYRENWVQCGWGLILITLKCRKSPSDSCEFYPCTLGTSKACHPKVQGVFLNLWVSEDDSKAKMKVSPDYYLFIQGIFDDSANFTPEQIVQPWHTSVELKVDITYITATTSRWYGRPTVRIFSLNWQWICQKPMLLKSKLYYKSISFWSQIWASADNLRM